VIYATLGVSINYPQISAEAMFKAYISHLPRCQGGLLIFRYVSLSKSHTIVRQ